MNPERRGRFSQKVDRRPEPTKTLPDGVFETALLYAKRAFPEETLGVDDASFWVELEKKAGAFHGSRKEAIFQYYLRGSDHVALAESLIRFFPAF